MIKLKLNSRKRLSNVLENNIDGFFVWSFANSIQKLSRKLFIKIADVSYQKDIKGVQQLRANLAFMTGLKSDSIELEQLVKDGMRSYLRYWEDAFRLPTWNKMNLNKI